MLSVDIESGDLSRLRSHKEHSFFKLSLKAVVDIIPFGWTESEKWLVAGCQVLVQVRLLPEARGATCAGVVGT